MAGWDDEQLGSFGSAPQVPDQTWFPVNTATGAWQLPGVQPDSLAANVSSVPSLRAPDQAPLSLGQVAGGFAPTMTTPRSMDALTPARSPWQDVLTAVGGASGGGRGIQGAFALRDQQQQQQLQNRLTMRRQMLQEAQDQRAEIRDDFNTLVQLSNVKSKALRNLYTDRWVADMQARGKSLPADFVEAFKKTGIDEGQQMAKLLEPLLTESGLDPAVATQLLAEGRSPKDIMDAMEMAQKQKKLRLEQQESTSLTEGLATLGGASGVPASTPAPAPAPAARSAGGKAPMPVRMNNPLNIKQGPATQKWIDQGAGVPGDAATDGGRFIKFQTPQQGVEAAKDLLVSTVYSGLSVDAALKKWSNNGYGAEIVTGVDPTKKIADLTPNELTRTMGGMLERESGGTGGGAKAAAAGSAQEQATLADSTQKIAAMDQFIMANAGKGSDRAKATVAAIERQRDNLAKERDRLQDRIGELPRALEKQQLLEPGELAKAREARALVPIDTKTQETLSTNKSVYRSIGKIEQYFREGTDLPPDFVTLVAQDAPGIRAAMEADPKNATGILAQWETKLKGASQNDPNVNRFLSALGNMRDLIIRERSGGSVTGNELDRAMGAFMGSLPNINQAFSLFVQNLANVKETVVESLVTAGAASRPLAGGKAMYGTLPKEIRDRIDYAERGEDYPRAQMPQKSPSQAHAQPTPRTGTLAGPITPSVR